MSHADATTERDDARSLRVGRILNEYLDARVRGEVVSEGTLFARHPDLADELRQHLELLGELQPTGEKIEALITQGLLTRSDDARYLAELGAYKILGYVGRGGMGIVLRAYEESLNRRVALKILRPELADDRVALQRFTREAKAAAGLRHPNIVTVHAVGQERGTHFIAMEYIEGPSLAALIRESYQPSAISRRPSAMSRQPSGVSGSGPRPRVADSLISNPQSSIFDPQSPIPNRQPSTINPETIRHIFRQLLEALAAAHEAGLIHRDVKSSNILLDGWPSSEPRSAEAPEPPSAVIAEARSHEGTEARRENVAFGLRAERENAAAGPRTGRASVPPFEAAPQSSIPDRQSSIVKLADFGLARMVTAQTRVTLGESILGTPEYMSPEQARGDEHFDHRTDLYSAGVVLYEMLTGRTPFRADTPSAVIHQILNVAPPEPRTFNQDVDPALASLALRLMAKEPEDRLESAEKAIGALERARQLPSPELRRRSHKRLAIAVATLVVVIGGGWLARRLLTGEASGDRGPAQPITHVKLDGDSRAILVRYGNDAEWKLFAPPAFQSYSESFAEVLLADTDGQGTSVLVVGLVAPLDDSSSVLVGLDARGDELWRIPLDSEQQWPDCQQPRAWWLVRQMIAGDVDGVPGEEVVVVAQDPSEAPTRISVVAPSSGEIRSSFWHFGHIYRVRFLWDYFPDGRPAILAWGLNNKLDGFGDGLRSGEKQFAHWDIVSVVMILDPADMDGFGPPPMHSSRQVRISAARPRAYAFLDRPYSPTVEYVPDAQLREGGAPAPESGVDRTASVTPVIPSRHRATDDSGPWSELDVTATTAEGHPIGPAIVDRNLRIRQVGPTTPPATDAETRAFWERYWHAVIQNGKYVAE